MLRWAEFYARVGRVNDNDRGHPSNVFLALLSSTRNFRRGKQPNCGEQQETKEVLGLE